MAAGLHADSPRWRVGLRGLRRGGMGCVNIVNETDHHLIPGLLAPTHILLWIGIVLVRRRVVEGGGAVNARAGGKRQWLVQAVDRLPVEVVARHAQQYLLLAIGED